MPRRRSRAAAAIVATMGTIGVVVLVLAIAALLRRASSDAAWVAIVLGLLWVTWAVLFARLEDDERPGPHEPNEPYEPDGADQVVGDDDADTPPDRVMATVTTGLAITGSYVMIRMLGRPVDTALVGALTYPAWRLVNRGVDEWVRRREARNGGSGDAAPGPATD